MCSGNALPQAKHSRGSLLINCLFIIFKHPGSPDPSPRALSHQWLLEITHFIQECSVLSGNLSLAVRFSGFLALLLFLSCIVKNLGNINVPQGLRNGRVRRSRGCTFLAEEPAHFQQLQPLLFTQTSPRVLCFCCKNTIYPAATLPFANFLKNP